MKYSQSSTSRTILSDGIILAIFSLVMAACAPYGASAQGATSNTPAAPVGASPSTTPIATPVPGTSNAPTASGTPITSSGGSGEVQVANNSKFGQILVTSSGLTLYTFDYDQAGVSRCTDSACVKYWPPYLASTQPMSVAGITGQLGLITRSDGMMQVTYNDKPLYTFAFDKNPGDATGDGINQFGGVWHVVVIGSATGIGTGTSTGNNGNGGSSGGYGNGGYK